MPASGGRGSQVQEAGAPAPEAETAQISPQNESRVGSPATGLPACPLRDGQVSRVPRSGLALPGIKT